MQTKTQEKVVKLVILSIQLTQGPRIAMKDNHGGKIQCD